MFGFKVICWALLFIFKLSLEPNHDYLVWIPSKPPGDVKEEIGDKEGLDVISELSDILTVMSLIESLSSSCRGIKSSFCPNAFGSII
jgi:hypothetical protein